MLKKTLFEISEYGLGLDYPAFRDEVYNVVIDENIKLSDCIKEHLGDVDPGNFRELGKVLMSNGYSDVTQLSFKVLKENKGRSEIFNLLFSYAKNAQLLHLYGEKLCKLMDADCRVHPIYSTSSTKTGRLSATRPAAMSFDRRLRAYMMPKPGYTIVEFDFSANEMRVAAALAGDKILISELSDPSFDIHRENGALIFNKNVSCVTDSERKAAKALGFAVLYGMTPEALAKKLSYATGERFTTATAESFINAFYYRYPALKHYQEKLIRRELPCQTLNGETDFSHQLLTRSQKINYPVQGTAAVGFKKVLCAVHNELSEYKICLPVHDALFVEIPEKDVQKAVVEISATMYDIMTEYLGVPSFVEVKSLYSERR